MRDRKASEYKIRVLNEMAVPLMNSMVEATPPRVISLLCFNCQRLSAVQIVNDLQDLLQRLAPKVVFLM